MTRRFEDFPACHFCVVEGSKIQYHLGSIFWQDCIVYRDTLLTSQSIPSLYGTKYGNQADRMGITTSIKGNQKYSKYSCISLLYGFLSRTFVICYIVFNIVFNYRNYRGPKLIIRLGIVRAIYVNMNLDIISIILLVPFADVETVEQKLILITYPFACFLEKKIFLNQLRGSIAVS